MIALISKRELDFFFFTSKLLLIPEIPKIYKSCFLYMIRLKKLDLVNSNFRYATFFVFI